MSVPLVVSTLHEFPQGKNPAKKAAFSAMVSIDARRSASRQRAVLEGNSPFGADSFADARVADRSGALAVSQRACDASQ